MNALTLAALATATLFQQTDTVIPLDGATRLDVETPAGSIVVTTWDRPEVRVRASHSSRTYIDVDRRDSEIDVEAEARVGPATIVDYEITVPASLDLDLGGMWADITVEGVNGEVTAETNQGEVRIRGGRGTVSAASVAGLVVVEGARGSISAETVAGDIRITGSSGEVFAESVGGNIVLEDVDATLVEAGTTGGRTTYSGTLQPGGEYFFGSHGGSITVHVPAGTGATFNLATVFGTIHSDLPGAPAQFEKGERHSFTVDGGGALVEIETFGGRISVVRR